METGVGAELEGCTGVGDGMDADGTGAMAFVAGLGAGVGIGACLASSSTDVPALVPTIMSDGNDGTTGAGMITGLAGGCEAGFGGGGNFGKSSEANWLTEAPMYSPRYERRTRIRGIDRPDFAAVLVMMSLTPSS